MGEVRPSPGNRYTRDIRYASARDDRSMIVHRVVSERFDRSALERGYESEDRAQRREREADNEQVHREPGLPGRLQQHGFEPLVSLPARLRRLRREPSARSIARCSTAPARSST